MGKPRSHLLDVYSVWLHVATDRKQWNTLRKTITSLEKRPPDSIASTKHEAEEINGGAQVQHFVVYINLAAHTGDGRLPERIVETCAHEAAHVAGLILDHFSVEYDGCTEPHAYLVGWVTQWLWEATT